MTESETQLDAALTVFDNANSDEERLVALLLITRCNLPNEDERLKIAHHVGFNFIHRLLVSQPTSENDAAATAKLSPYQRLGLGVLALYTSAPALVEQVAFLEQLPEITAIMDKASEQLQLQACKDRTAVMPMLQVLSDCLACLAAVGQTQGGPAQLLKYSTVETACGALQTCLNLFRNFPEAKAAANTTEASQAPSTDDSTPTSYDTHPQTNSDGSDISSSAILDSDKQFCEHVLRNTIILLSQLVQPQPTGGCSADVMLTILNTLTALLEHCPQTLLFFCFEATTSAVSALASAPATSRKRTLCESKLNWQQHVARAVTGAIQNRLGPELRTIVLRLASFMCMVLGSQWIFSLDKPCEEAPTAQPSSKSDDAARTTTLSGQRAFRLLLQLAHVEMRVELENDRLDSVAAKQSTLLACCNITQSAIEHLLRLDVDNADVADFDPVLTIVKAAVVAAATFVDNLAEQRYGLDTGKSDGSTTNTTTDLDVLNGQLYHLLQSCCAVVGTWMSEENTLLQDESVAVVGYVCSLLINGDKIGQNAAFASLRSLLMGLPGLLERASMCQRMVELPDFMSALAKTVQLLSESQAMDDQRSQADLVLVAYTLQTTLLNSSRDSLTGIPFHGLQDACMQALEAILERHAARVDYVPALPPLEGIVSVLWLMLHKGVAHHYGSSDAFADKIATLFNGLALFWRLLDADSAARGRANISLQLSILAETLTGSIVNGERLQPILFADATMEARSNAMTAIDGLVTLLQESGGEASQPLREQLEKVNELLKA
eukprot:TRINITY_DN4971_c0_g1_i1.p1 TRINITY_DN4971_c0_g1~~TRINITY_DN4971_c0_g1_i1.p1  ORF type:complete len:780 (+),score=170.02 TRINITY_DN4971_c0_g1_i1:63-2402(+)